LGSPWASPSAVCADDGDGDDDDDAAAEFPSSADSRAAAQARVIACAASASSRRSRACASKMARNTVVGIASQTRRRDRSFPGSVRHRTTSVYCRNEGGLVSVGGDGIANDDDATAT